MLEAQRLAAEEERARVAATAKAKLERLSAEEAEQERLGAEEAEAAAAVEVARLAAVERAKQQLHTPSKQGPSIDATPEPEPQLLETPAKFPEPEEPELDEYDEPEPHSDDALLAIASRSNWSKLLSFVEKAEPDVLRAQCRHGYHAPLKKATELGAPSEVLDALTHGAMWATPHHRPASCATPKHADPRHSAAKYIGGTYSAAKYKSPKHLPKYSTGKYSVGQTSAEVVSVQSAGTASSWVRRNGQRSAPPASSTASGNATLPTPIKLPFTPVSRELADDEPESADEPDQPSDVSLLGHERLARPVPKSREGGAAREKWTWQTIAAWVVIVAVVAGSALAELGALGGKDGSADGSTAPLHVRTRNGCECLPMTRHRLESGVTEGWEGCGEAGWCDVASGCVDARDHHRFVGGWDYCE
jgi:hypothetical protein